jgi:hypothetical protein
MPYAYRGVSRLWVSFDEVLLHHEIIKKNTEYKILPPMYLRGRYRWGLVIVLLCTGYEKSPAITRLLTWI